MSIFISVVCENVIKTMQHQRVGENALLEEVLKEIEDLDLEQAKKFYKTMWKVIDKYVGEGKEVIIPLHESVSSEHLTPELSLLKKSQQNTKPPIRQRRGRKRTHIDPPSGIPIGMRRISASTRRRRKRF